MLWQALILLSIAHQSAAQEQVWTWPTKDEKANEKPALMRRKASINHHGQINMDAQVEEHMRRARRGGDSHARDPSLLQYESIETTGEDYETKERANASSQVAQHYWGLVKFVYTRNKCMRVHQRNRWGGRIYSYPCRSWDWHQYWRWISWWNGQIRGVEYGRRRWTPAMCLDASQRNKNGGRLHMWGCQHWNANQKWTVDNNNYRIKNKYGICVEGRNRFSTGADMQMGNCDTKNYDQNLDWKYGWWQGREYFTAGGSIRIRDWGARRRTSTYIRWGCRRRYWYCRRRDNLQKGHKRSSFVDGAEEEEEEEEVEEEEEEASRPTNFTTRNLTKARQYWGGYGQPRSWANKYEQFGSGRPRNSTHH